MEKKEKDSYIRIRCTSKFKKETEILAESKGLSLSALVTMLLTEEIKKNKTPVD